MTIDIRRVEKRSELKRMLLFQWQIYRGDPCWVPPLIFDRMGMTASARHPFYLEAEVEFYCACDGEKILATAALIDNRCYNRLHSEKTAFFGFFEALRRPDAVEALFGKLRLRARERGLDVLRGPVNLSSNYEIGLLVEGFGLPPAVMMTYNPPWYEDLLTGCGLKKVKDLYAYRISRGKPMNPKLERVTQRLMERTDFRLRTLRLKDLDREMKIVQEIYNDAWSRNWGFVTMSDAEVKLWARYLKLILRPELVLFGELRGEAIGFSLTIPNINEIQIKNRGGRLLPFAWRFLTGRRRIGSCRIMVLGIKKEFQQRGFDSFFYYQTWKTASRYYSWGEASWVLEDNLLMNRGIEMLGGERYKKYRLLECPTS